MLCGGLDGACVFGLRTGACVLWEDLMELVCCGEDSMELVYVDMCIKLLHLADTLQMANSHTFCLVT